MAGFWQRKVKRKDFEEAYDEFAEFSLSSPAPKIRRLDSELMPIVEEVEPALTPASNQHQSQGIISADVSSMNEAMPAIPSNNEERAIVLYKPVEAPLILSSGRTNVSLQISSDLIHGLGNHIFKPGNQSFDEKDEKTDVDSRCLAVVPWVPSEAAMTVHRSGGYKSQSKLPQEPMASAEAEAESMEVEETREQAITYGESGEGFQQWWQHCMTPQLLPTISSPMMWSW
ncbi:hypothetical protein C4D60_Mb02t00220 [Musa balbisiana]|uniref:Uncharacterized protein n=1 Tax=Musa balbisiana TaxID=52838 RepID=A0A4V4H2C3_MUSBA|nr:hypothetical protein C4D60_Mb02t00220 [Musa balbisiana]